MVRVFFLGKSWTRDGGLELKVPDRSLFVFYFEEALICPMSHGALMTIC